MIYQYGGQTYSITLQALADGRYRATIGDRVIEFAAEAIESGWLLTLDRRYRVYALSGGSEHRISFEGETYTLTGAAGRKRRAKSRENDLTAQMPGQVREVFVQVGESVKSGQTLLILEAMKMEIRLSAPTDGQVKRLLVKAGDVVDRGQRLIEME